MYDRRIPAVRRGSSLLVDHSLFGGFTPPAVRQTSVVFLWYYINKKAPALHSGGAFS
jgi:hypothetical protein